MPKLSSSVKFFWDVKEVGESEGGAWTEKKKKKKKRKKKKKI